MMNLQTPKKFKLLIDQAHDVALNVLRPISRKYDKAEHQYPQELDMLAAVVDGMNDSGEGMNAGAAVNKHGDMQTGNKNGINMSTALSIIEMCYGDTGLLLSMPRQGLGNSAIAAVATPAQIKKFKGLWAAMAITEPNCGSDSAAIRTTATRQGNDYILNGEKIFVTSGERADAIVVWATLDKDLGRAAIKSFVVEKGTAGMTVERLEHKLGIKASDTATIRFVDCRVPAENLLGNPDIDVTKGFAGVMETFDNTRPLVAAMAVGCAKAALERIKEIFAALLDPSYQTPYLQSPHIAAQIYKMEAEWEAVRLLTLKAAWMADNQQPNSKDASIAKAKAGRVCNDITLKCVELAAAIGYNEDEMLEKWARDSKILDIFEGTQQIQQLIIARRELGKSSSQLK